MGGAGPPSQGAAQGLVGEESGAVVSPMQGTVLGVEVADGQSVEAGGLICVIEAMKMENEIVAHRDGVVSELAVAPASRSRMGSLSASSARRTLGATRSLAQAVRGGP